jgi:hypothetical protein
LANRLGKEGILYVRDKCQIIVSDRKTSSIIQKNTLEYGTNFGLGPFIRFLAFLCGY